MVENSSGGRGAGRGLRIGLVTELYSPSVGGQQTRFQALAEGLSNMGASVTVITVAHAEGLAQVEDINGVHVRRGPVLPRYMSPFFSQTVRSPWGMVCFGLRTRRELRAGRFDAIYFNQWPYLPVLFAPRHVRHRSGIDWCEVRDEMIHSLPQRLLPRMAAFNLSVNQWTAAQLALRSGTSVGYLPSGISTNLYDASRPNRQGFLFLGRLVPNKNLPLLVEGYRTYVQGGGEEDLTIAGAGTEASRLNDLISKLPSYVKAKISLEGEVTNSRKIELLASRRLLLVPSLREGFPNIVAEAMASGMPTVTVSSPQNGTSHVVDHYKVGRVSAPTPEAFAAAIHEALAEWDATSLRCVQRASELDWRELSRQLFDLLVGLAEKSNA